MSTPSKDDIENTLNIIDKGEGHIPWYIVLNPGEQAPHVYPAIAGFALKGEANMEELMNQFETASGSDADKIGISCFGLVDDEEEEEIGPFAAMFSTSEDGEPNVLASIVFGHMVHGTVFVIDVDYKASEEDVKGYSEKERQEMIHHAKLFTGLTKKTGDFLLALKELSEDFRKFDG